MSKIQQELAKVTGVTPESGQKITDGAYVKALIRAVASLSDKDWNGLSDAAQDWYNEAADANNAKKEVPTFPDYVPEPEQEAAPRSRRRSSGDEEKSAAYTPQKGDKVKILTSRDKLVEGEVVDPDDKGDLVLLVDGDEVAYDLSKLKNIEKVEPAEPEGRSRRRKADDEDDKGDFDPNGEPEVDDTVQVTTARGTVKMGKVLEVSKSDIVIVDTTGDELEYARDKLQGLVIKVKGKAAKAGADEGKKSRGSSDEKSDAKPEKTRSTKSENGGVSVTTRIRELMCEDPLDPLSLEDLTKAIKKEGLSANDSTLKMVHADCVKLFGMLKAGKHLK